MAAEVKTDLKLLLECLKCHMGDVEVQRGTLLTTADVCSSSGDAQEYFRECGGINFVLNLLTSTEDVKLKIAALYMLGCACEKNVFSQKRLCTPAVFKFLYCQLISKWETSENLRRTSAFLLLCLVTNNGEGQNLARTSHCLEALLKLFRTLYPTNQPTSGSPDETWMDSNADQKRLDLWTTVTSTLCGCVNNPQNEENQLMCSSAAFPAAINIISKTKNPTVIRLLSSFLSLTIANNGSNQDRFAKLGGLEILVDLLHTTIEELLQQPDQDVIQAAVQLANVFVSCVTDCEQNHSRLVDLNLVPMLVQLLSMDFIESDVRLKVIITLGHLTEKCERSQRQLLESDGLSLLVHIMADNQDEEFNKAAMYLLTSCVDLVSCMEEESLNAGNGLSTSTKPKSADKRNKARAERETTLIQLRRLQPNAEDVPSGIAAPSGLQNNEPDPRAVTEVAPAVTSTNTNPSSLSSHKMSETTEDNVINELLRQLHEEKSTRERLENEKKAFEKREETRKRSKGEAKEMAEAITLELERQYKEQEHLETPRENQERDVEQRPKSVSPVKQLPSPAMKEVQQRLEALEKSLNDISSMGNQLAEQIAQAKERDQPTNNQDRPNSTADRFKTLSDFPPQTNEDRRENNPNRNQKVKSEQLHDRVNKYLRSLNDGTENVDKSQTMQTDAPLKSPNQTSLFRVPSCPVRRQHLGAARRIATDQQSLPIPNVIKMRGSESGLSHAEPSEEGTLYESDTESCVSGVTSLSAVTDTEMSMTASDMYLVKQAQSTHQMPSTSREHRTASSHPHILSPPSRPNRSFRVNYSSQTGATFTLPASTHQSDPTKPGVSRLGVGKDNSRESKVVYQFKGSQSDLSGISSLHGVPKCPGCAPPINRPLLNSRNFLYTLERSPHTCSEHRELHRLIKQDIHQRRMAKSSDISPESTRSTRSNIVRNLSSATRSRNRSPLSTASSFANKRDGQHREKTMSSISRRRRRRQEFTQEEIHNLINGVAKKGKHWNCILWAYTFAPGRTAVDLKDKYRRMQAQNYPGVLPLSPFASLKSFKRRQTRKIIDRTWRP
ncbi:telomere repeats-binding bouquet formation protein 1-like [Patiria miniata]|uniref:HTH myb-type domain-containing protein n=1 Tax=Patiria miniata TaxID=46514 RepID=A0A913ZRU6_PATMI|nr:telomere repeats-binding bouquet formation protein 1-like [Patiria miniata]